MIHSVQPGRIAFRARRRMAAVFPAFLACAMAVAGAEKPGRESRAKRGPAVLLVADAAGGNEFHPSPEHPVHYVVLVAKERALGGAFGRNMPAPAEVEQQVDAALAGQGYVRTKLGGPVPALALVITWGEARLENWEYPELNPETGETQMVTVAFNLGEIRQLLGIDKAERRYLSFTEASELNSAAQGERLYLMVAALDLAALRRGEQKLVWRVRMSIGDGRSSLPGSLPVMLQSAAPHIGRNLDRPVLVNDRLRAGTVRMDDVKVLEVDVPPPTTK